MRIAALGAHPSDEIELGCGGLLLNEAIIGYNAHMYKLTRGSGSGNPEERTKELIQSSKIIGADAGFELRITSSEKLTQSIEDRIFENSQDIAKRLLTIYVYIR
jgi:LmbE family N-acetylglucosaminyl deacetylase